MGPLPGPGDQIGAYRVVQERGRGGMAAVLEVEHLETGEKRAIKLLLPSRGGPDLARRLLREHRALSRLDHANVVKATLNALQSLRTRETIYKLRGKKLAEQKAI